MMAKKVIEREQSLKRDMGKIRTEMGLGASGFPHIGSLGDASRSYAVTLALKNLDCNSELVAFCDDKDGLRKVPAGLPETSLKAWKNTLATPCPAFLTRLGATKATANT